MATRFLVVAGARPQFVKAAALLPALRGRGSTWLVHTGQHEDPAMVDAHFEDLGLPPQPDARLERLPGDRAERLGRMIAGLSRLVARERPEVVVVVGDTDSTLAGALAASLQDRRVAHVEAGARSGERDLPEERNRILTDELSDYLFCSTPGHAANLAGRSGVEITGDVMVDVLARNREAIAARVPSRRHAYGVLTLHRARSADDPEVVARVLAAAAAGPVPIVFPKHPRTAEVRVPDGVEVRAPLPYLEFLGLVAGARYLLTDSGGLQKEAYCLGVPCITLREATEWGETVAAGWNVLVGTDADRIAAALTDPPRGHDRPALYGDGGAAERIAARLASQASHGRRR